MTISYDVNHDLKRMVTTFSGNVSAMDIEEHVKRRIVDGTDRYEQIVDLRAAQLVLTTEETHKLAETLAQMASQTKPSLTVVVAPESLNFGLARMVASLTDTEYPLHVVRTIGEAEAWIGWKTG
jgi:hypothetical protein